MGSLWTTFSPRGRGHPLPAVPRGPLIRRDRGPPYRYTLHMTAPPFLLQRSGLLSIISGRFLHGAMPKRPPNPRLLHPQVLMLCPSFLLLLFASFFSFLFFFFFFFHFISKFVNISKGENGKKVK
jgi:hypothetical protein